MRKNTHGHRGRTGPARLGRIRLTAQVLLALLPGAVRFRSGFVFRESAARVDHSAVGLLGREQADAARAQIIPCTQRRWDACCTGARSPTAGNICETMMPHICSSPEGRSAGVFWPAISYLRVLGRKLFLPISALPCGPYLATVLLTFISTAVQPSTGSRNRSIVLART